MVTLPILHKNHRSVRSRIKTEVQTFFQEFARISLEAIAEKVCEDILQKYTNLELPEITF